MLFFVGVVLFLSARCQQGLHADDSPPVVSFTCGNDAEVGRQIETPDGYAQLEWTTETELESPRFVQFEFQLEIAERSDFSDRELVYQGKQTSAFVSGLSDGTYFYRIRGRNDAESEWGAWSPTLRIGVAHHSLTTALVLFGAGAVVFVSTAVFVFWHAVRGGTSEEGMS